MLLFGRNDFPFVGANTTLPLIWSLMVSAGEGTSLLAINFTSDGIVTSISRSVESILDYSPQDLLDLPVTQILSDRSVFEVLEMINSAKKQGFWQGNIAHRNRMGNSMYAQGKVTQMPGREGQDETYLMLSTFSCSSQQGAAAHPVLQEVAVVLRALAHEMNNPLAVIMGFAQLILLNMNNNGKNTSDMERLYSEIKRLIQVVEKLQSYAISLQNDQPAQLDRKTS